MRNDFELKEAKKALQNQNALLRLDEVVEFQLFYSKGLNEKPNFCFKVLDLPYWGKLGGYEKHIVEMNAFLGWLLDE